MCPLFKFITLLTEMFEENIQYLLYLSRIQSVGFKRRLCTNGVKTCFYRSLQQRFCYCHMQGQENTYKEINLKMSIICTGSKVMKNSLINLK